MKLKIIFSIAFFFFLLSLTNCNKDDNDVVDGNLLFNVKWHLDSTLVEVKNSRSADFNTKSFIYPPECESDNYLVFYTSKATTYYGRIKCNSTETNSSDGSWKLEGNILRYDNKVFDVSKLQSNKMYLSWDTSYVTSKFGVEVRSDQSFLYYYSTIK
jgi:hypothetical protein